MTFEEKLEAFRSRLEQEQGESLKQRHPTLFGSEEYKKKSWAATLVGGKKYTKVNVGDSGKYMVDNQTEEIFGILGYGKINKKKPAGTLDTIADWDWSGWHARKK